MHREKVDITRLLARWRDGDRDALDMLTRMIEGELRRIARHHLNRERTNHPIQPSSLVQETFVRLLQADVAGGKAGWRDRAHFFAVASTVMRHVLVDYARSRHRLKRGDAAHHVPISEAHVLNAAQLEEIVLIDLALQRLQAVDERKSKVLEMRLFGGLSVKETAAALGVAPNTVVRDWKFAFAWLRQELSCTNSPTQ
jgi:RNA polymerase sigma factor (TIGR02999 family)